MLTIKELEIHYDDRIILKEGNLTAKVGLTCITGESGSGKTSILNALAYQIPFICSEYTLGDTNLKSMENIHLFVRQHFAYLIQGNNFISDLNCYENICLYAQMGGKECSSQEMESILSLLKLKIDQKIYPDTLSGGERQKLAIAQALAKDSPIILCDEITASLDNEAKKEIILTLKRIAKEYNKVIIITSHDEEIYEYCDQLYKIEEEKLILIKDNKLNKLNISVEKKTYGFMSNKILRKYLLRKIDRRPLMYTLYILICVLVVSISATLIHYRKEFISAQARVLGQLSQNELMIVNQTMPAMGINESYLYDEHNKSFDQETIKQIKEIEKEYKIYPYYWDNTIGDMRDMTNPNENIDIQFISNSSDMLKKQIGRTNVLIIPYYQEQYFEKKQHIINDETEFGIYLTKSFLTAIGIEDANILKGYRLKTKIMVPVAFEEDVAYIEKTIPETGEIESIKVDVYMPIYKEMEIELPVIGVIDTWYAEEVRGNNIYLPIEYMESLRIEASREIVLEDGQYKWEPNAYILFAENAEDLENINITIRNIDPTITTGSRYQRSSNIYAQRSYMNTYSLIALGIVLTVGIILTYAYGIYYYQKNKIDIVYLKRNGANRKEFTKILKMDSIIQVIIVTLLSIPTVTMIMIVGNHYGIISGFSIFSKQSFMIVINIVIITIIQSIIARLYYYKKIRRE